MWWLCWWEYKLATNENNSDNNSDDGGAEADDDVHDSENNETNMRNHNIVNSKNENDKKLDKANSNQTIKTYIFTSQIKLISNIQSHCPPLRSHNEIYNSLFFLSFFIF